MEKYPLIALTLCLLLCPAYSEAQRPCRDTTVHFSDTICEGETYTWGGRTLDHTGIFYDTLQRVDASCDSVSILHLFVLSWPRFDHILLPICRGETGYEIYAGSTASYFTWSSDPPDPAFRILQPNFHVFVNPTVPTVYHITADYGATPTCPQQFDVSVNPLQPVQASLHVAPTSLDNDHTELMLHDNSLGNHEAPYGGWAGRNWYVDGERLANQQPDLTLTIAFPYPDTVTVFMEAFTPTCLDSAIVHIPFNKNQTYIPNVFVPGAEANNRFLPIIQNLDHYQLYIYNRQGRLLFATADPTQAWDGTSGASPCPQGVYNYRIRYSHSHSPTEYHTLSGSLLLLR